MKKLLFLGACLVALASQPVMAQTGTADVVVVKLHRTSSRTGHILISRGSSASEDIEYIDNKPAMESEALQVAFAKLYQQGYRLRSTLGLSVLNSPLFIFTKD
jgi:hypothetical protein